MKKLILTTAIVLTMGLGAYAQSLLGKSNAERSGNRDLTTPAIMETHDHTEDVDGNGKVSLGSGIAVLLSLGSAYVVAKKRKEE